MFKKFFCRTAELMGVKWYKKYWPNGGSYWNEEHIVPDNKFQLKEVIRSSNENFRQHFGAMVNEFIIFIPIYSSILYYFKNKPEEFNIFLRLFSPMIGVSTMVHLYGMMVHKYNIIKAKEKITELKKIQQAPIVIQPDGEEQFWYKYKNQIGKEIFVYTVNNLRADLSFKFSTEEACDKFLEKIMIEKDDIIMKMAIDKNFANQYYLVNS